MHGILLLDKPTGISSNKALQQAKRLFDAQKAGHTGSLDPLATGMLPICFGEATKLSQYLLNADKSYLAEIMLGEITDSADSDGDVIETRPVPKLTLQQIKEISQQFVGSQMQVPPMVSAIKVDGKRLYKLAREGITVEREPRAVVIHHLNIEHYSHPVIRLSVSCSKGTYIRSLATDIGEALGCGGHIQMLRRTHVSPFDDHTMLTLSQLEAAAELDSLLMPIDAGLSHLPQTRLAEADIAAFGQGRQVPANVSSAQPDDDSSHDPAGDFVRLTPFDNHASTPIRVYSEAGRLLGLAKVAEDGLVQPVKVIQWD